MIRIQFNTDTFAAHLPMGLNQQREGDSIRVYSGMDRSHVATVTYKGAVRMAGPRPFSQRHIQQHETLRQNIKRAVAIAKEEV